MASSTQSGTPAFSAPELNDALKEPGCEHFEAFQSIVNPDKIILLERWTDQAALDVHAKLNRPQARPDLREGSGEVERSEYNRTR